MFEGYQEALSIRHKEIYMQSVMTAAFTIGFLTGNGKDLPTYEDIFESNTEEYKRKQLQKTVDQLTQFAQNANKQRRQKDGRRET